MKSDQILDAMNDIRDEWILDAETAGNAIPRWLKWISVAACLACAVLAGFLLLLPRNPAPGSSLRPAELPDMTNPSQMPSAPVFTPAQSPSPSLPKKPQTILISGTGLKLSVPTVYAEAGDFTVDTPYDPQVDDGVRFDNVVFGFFNHWALDPDIPCYEPRGFVWCILRDPIETYDFEAVEKVKNEIFLLNRTILATDEKYVYTLIHPHLGGFPTDQVLAHTHYARLAESPAILQDFIDRNGLTSDGQWEDLLREMTIDPCYKLLYG